MARMQSVQSQCCCCSMSVFSALFGIIMLSTGICLVLNYRIMEVDTTGLPPEWQNEEGKKIVGIILICCGLGGMALSTLVTALYFTVCSRTKTAASVMPSEPAVAADKNHHQPSSTEPHSTNNHHSHTKHNTSRHGKRPKKKRPPPHLKGYKTRLAPHQEVINENEHRHENVDLDDSSRSLDSSQTSSSKNNSYVGDGRRYDSCGVMETSLQNETNPPFVICKPDEFSDKLSHQDILKTKPEEEPTGSAIEQPLQKIITEAGATNVKDESLFGNKLDDSPTHSSEPVVVKTRIQDLPNDSNDLFKNNAEKMPNTSTDPLMLKSLSVPPIQTSSLTLDSDEEVSQIEEIKQLDKDVANLLV